MFEEFGDAIALAEHEWKNAGRILKVILCGSYARGTCIDEPRTARGYLPCEAGQPNLGGQQTLGQTWCQARD